MRYKLDVHVVYEAEVEVQADSIPEAEKRVREIVKPQSVFCDGLMNDGDDYEMDPHPTVHFLHHKEIPED